MTLSNMLGNNFQIVYIAYCIVSGKCYVGQTVDFEKRKRNHLNRALARNNSQRKFYCGLRKHGPENFRWSIIQCTELGALTEWEDYWVEKLDAIKNGYNHLKPSSNYDWETRKRMSLLAIGRPMSEETKKKLSLANKGQNNWLGKHHNEETKEKMRLSGLGHDVTDESKKKMSQSHIGLTPSLETRLKISKAMVGKNHSSETKFKISIGNKGKVSWNKGKTCTEEHKMNVSLGLKGRRLSEEHKRRISESKKKAWQP